MTTYQLSDADAEQLLAPASEQDAVYVLWQFGFRQRTYEPGSFYQSLLETIARADPANQLKLAFGWAGLVGATQVMQGHPAGVLLLRRKAGIGDAVCDCGGTGFVRDLDFTGPTGGGTYLKTCPACGGRLGGEGPRG